jgi:hypothetical protein
MEVRIYFGKQSRLIIQENIHPVQTAMNSNRIGLYLYPRCGPFVRILLRDQCALNDAGVLRKICFEILTLKFTIKTVNVLGNWVKVYISTKFLETQFMKQSPQPTTHVNLRFEYAWRWFSFHAKQRISMFNFFLIGIGILANAYVFLVMGDINEAAGTLAIIGALASAVFVLLDRRNHQLVHIGERLLKELENNDLFIDTTQASTQGGSLQREQVLGEPPFFLKHWFLIEGFQVMACVCFIIAAAYAFLAR